MNGGPAILFANGSVFNAHTATTLNTSLVFPPRTAVSQSDELMMLSPESRLLLLDHIFLRFDEMVKEADALKIETVGEVYLVAANVAGVSVPDHVLVLSRLALKFIATVREIETAFRADVEGFSDSALRLEVRVGINSGPVTAGVIGRLLPRYRIFGDTVNTAARMETSAEPGRVQLSAASADLLCAMLPPEIGLAPRGEISVKGKVSRWKMDHISCAGLTSRLRARCKRLRAATFAPRPSSLASYLFSRVSFAFPSKIRA